MDSDELHADCKRERPHHSCTCFLSAPCTPCVECHAWAPRPKVSRSRAGVWLVDWQDGSPEPVEASLAWGWRDALEHALSQCAERLLAFRA